jgi:glycosyltransferase involved in cell wall biosynthesis
MKLLIVAQALDANHPVLGFFVRWVEELAKRVELVTVIASFVGEYKLPPNVSVHSLGKEIGLERESRALRLPALAIALRKEYNTVLVHMIPEFVVASGIPWCLMGKRVGLWYNHTVANPWLSTAVFLSHCVFFTSPFATTARFGKAKRMPAGIDTDLFKPDPSVRKIPGSVYFQGRLSPAKNIHVLLEAFALLHGRGIAKRLTIVGPEESSYAKPLKEKYAKLISEGAIIFAGPRRNDETPALYSAHAVSVNLTAAGNYDKTVFESIACGTPALVASPAFNDILPPEYRIASLATKDVVKALERALTDPSFPPVPREAVVAKHGLPALADALVEALS